MPRNNHNGVSDAIREALRAHGILTSAEISERTGFTPRQIRQALCLMTTRIGGVYTVGKRGIFNLYGLPGVHERVKSSTMAPRKTGGNIAGPRYVPPFRELDRDPFEHMRMALGGR